METTKENELEEEVKEELKDEETVNPLEEEIKEEQPNETVLVLKEIVSMLASINTGLMEKNSEPLDELSPVEKTPTPPEPEEEKPIYF